FLVRRAEHLRFFGGFWAFPGGRVAPEDAETPGAPLSGRRAAAARELFEETGVLVARRADGSFPPASPELEALRRDMIAGRQSFAAVLRRLGLEVDFRDFTHLGDIT